MTYDELLFALQKEADQNPGRLRQQAMVVVGKAIAIPIADIGYTDQQQSTILRVPIHSLFLKGDAGS